MDDPKEICLKLNLLQTYEKLCEEFPVKLVYLRMLKCCYNSETMEINTEAFDMVLKCFKAQGSLSALPFEIYNFLIFKLNGWKNRSIRLKISIKHDLPILEHLLKKADVYGIEFNARNHEEFFLPTLLELAMSDGFEALVKLLKKFNFD